MATELPKWRVSKCPSGLSPQRRRAGRTFLPIAQDDMPSNRQPTLAQGWQANTTTAALCQLWRNLVMLSGMRVSAIVPCYVNRPFFDASRCQCYIVISRVEFQEAIKILTGSTMCQDKDGYFCDNVVYSEMF